METTSQSSSSSSTIDNNSNNNNGYINYNNNSNNNNNNMQSTLIDYILGIMNTIDIPQNMDYTMYNEYLKSSIFPRIDPHTYQYITMNMDVFCQIVVKRLYCELNKISDSILHDHYELSLESNALQSYYYLLYERCQQYQEYVTITYNTPVVEDLFNLTSSSSTSTSTPPTTPTIVDSTTTTPTSLPLSPPPSSSGSASTTTIQSINSTLSSSVTNNNNNNNTPTSTNTVSSPPSSSTSSNSSSKSHSKKDKDKDKDKDKEKEKEKEKIDKTKMAPKPLPIIGYKLAEELPTLEQYLFLNPIPKDVIESVAQSNPKKKNWRDDKGSLSIVDRVPIFIQEFTVANSWGQLREFLNVLESKITNSCRKRYVEEGGLKQLHTCLNYSQVSQTLPRDIILILKSLKQLPITLEHLQKEPGVGKTIRKLKQHSNASVKDLSGDLERMWMNLLKNANTPSSKEKEKEKDSTDQKKRLRDPSIEKDPKKIKGENGSLSLKQQQQQQTQQQQSLKQQSPTLPGVKKDLKEFEDLFMTKLGKQNKTDPTSTTTTPSNYTFNPTPVKKKHTQPIEQPQIKSTTTATTSSSSSSSSPPSTSLTSSASTSTTPNPKPTINITSSGMESISLLDMTKVAPRGSTGWDLPKSTLEEDNEVVPDPNRRKSSKGRVNVRWAPDDKLVQIKEFESTEEIEEGDHDHIDFEQARQMEHENEKLHLNKYKEIEVNLEYKSPFAIDADQLSSFVYRPGTESQERTKQQERENYTLMEIFLDSNIPQTPQEPPSEADYDESSVPIIPAENTKLQPYNNDKIVSMNVNDTLDPSQVDEILSSFDNVNNINKNQPQPQQQQQQQPQLQQQSMTTQQQQQTSQYPQNNTYNNGYNYNTNNNNMNMNMGWSNQSYGNNYNNNMSWNNANTNNNNMNMNYMWNNNNNNTNMNYNNNNMWNNNNMNYNNNSSNNNNNWNNMNYNNNNMNYNNNSNMWNTNLPNNNNNMNMWNPQQQQQ